MATKKWRALKFCTMTSKNGTIIQFAIPPLNIRIAATLNSLELGPGEVLLVNTKFSSSIYVEFLVYTDKFDAEEMQLDIWDL